MAGLRGLFVADDAQATNTIPRGARQALAGLIGRSTAGAAQSGVVLDTMTPVVSGAASMSYSVRACALVSQWSASAGPVVYANDAAVSVATTAAPSSNSRYDLVWARHNQTTADGGSGTANDVVFGVTQGTVAASPVVPATPTGAVALARALVPAGTTATSALVITQVHEWVAANGGLVPRTKGGVVFDAWNGTSRVVVASSGLTQSGQASFQTQSATVTTGTVTFPTAFAAVPRVSVTPVTALPNGLSVSVSSVSATQLVIAAYRNATGTATSSFDWIAHGTPA
ncbi:MAG: hypothetical protein QM621_14960 [Aeromicrobium sp.]|uniref:hypothetical protein n=1 Tax=Aeromicrobium sp. TaxID=1871063 RepID=UPI0039E418CD